MTLSGISHTAVGARPQQNQGTAAEQSAGKRTDLASDGNSAGKKTDDTVTLARTERNGGQAAAIDTEAVAEVLPRTMTAILRDSKTAVSAQANVTSQAAQEFLADK